MKQSSMAVIGVIVVIVIVAIAALALSGQKNNSRSVTTSSYTTVATTAASNAIKNTTGVVNSTTTVKNSSSNKSNSTVPSNSVNQSNTTTKKYNVMVGSSPTIGNYLENSEGYTLYLLNSDTPYRTSTCTGTCASLWPPYNFSGNFSSISTPNGINVSAFGILTRPNGSRQLTYDGWPLYLFYKDTAPGQVNGNGVKAFGGTWYAVTVPTPTTS